MKSKEIRKLRESLKQTVACFLAVVITLTMIPPVSAEANTGAEANVATDVNVVAQANTGAQVNAAAQANAGAQVSAGEEPVQGVSPNGTVINLFDYWLEEQNSHDDTVISADPSLLQKGINEGHPLKFVKHGDASLGLGNINLWTGNEVPNTGIVENLLKDGYPVLKADRLTDITCDEGVTYGPESLAYLFDSRIDDSQVPGRKTYKNVQGMLQVDEQGYYYYKCEDNFAELDSTNGSNTFKIYGEGVRKEGVYNGSTGNTLGQFFPFNKYAEVKDKGSRDASINHYFGAVMKTRFVQESGGLTLKHGPVEFEFSGDDDVWIFMDDVLIADLGGNHNMTSVNINFHTGEIVINKGTVHETTTTLKDEFLEALGPDHYEMAEANWSGNTFADDTYHTFKLFYLERGNVDSNMNMKYNFAQVPESAFNKVDQYGRGVEGAVLKLYAANENYEIISDTPVYSGRTDAEGVLKIVDEEGLNMAFADLINISEGATHFVLKEDVPDGYRPVGVDTRLRLMNGVMVCDNTIESGTWASCNLLATAPYQLGLANGTTVDFIDEVSGEENGTVFAMILQYVGERDQNGNATRQSDIKSWRPIYGSAEDGYQLADVKFTGNTVAQDNADFVKGVIDVADTYDGENIFRLSSEGSVQCSMNSLPGDVRNYYYMRAKAGQVGKAKYTVAYYWTEANLVVPGSDTVDWSKATPDNTYRIRSTIDGDNQIERIFGVDLNVPNILPRIVVVKKNQAGEWVNGAKFAMYEVEEQADGKICYIASDGAKIFLDKDADGDGKGTASVKNDVGLTETTGAYEEGYVYEVNGETGVITVSGKIGATTAGGSTKTYTISPDENSRGRTLMGETTYYREIDQEGSYIFNFVRNGQYYIREISAPEGYKLNSNEVMTYSMPNANYINAGEADDGIVVGRTPGPLINSLAFLASKGQINNTLSWIYTHLSVSPPSKKFSDVTAENYMNTWRYITKQYAKDYETDTTENLVEIGGGASEAGEVTEGDNRLTAYLVYQKPEGGTNFNYVHNTSRTGEWAPMEFKNIAAEKRLFTDVGWSYLEIYQDTLYGSENHMDGADYTVIGDNIRHLFANSVFVLITDEGVGNLKVTKTVLDEGSDAGTTAGTATTAGTGAENATEAAAGTETFSFKVTLDDTTINGEYGEMIFTDGVAEFTLTDGGAKTASGLPETTGYTVTETDSKGYSVTATGDTGKIKAGETVTAAFVNEKKPVVLTPAEVVVKANKLMDNRTPGSADSFDFVLKDSDGKIIEQVRNKGEQIQFSPLSFDREGTYAYTVSELAGTRSDVNYDGSVYGVKVTVTKSGDKFTASSVYEKGGKPLAGADGKPMADADGKPLAGAVEPVFRNSTKSGGSDIGGGSTDSDSGIAITVNKVWKDGGEVRPDNGETRSDSVTVQLYCDGKAYGEKVTLNAQNGWSHRWTNMDKGHKWTAEEVVVPEGYTASVAVSGNVITITNTKEGTEKPVDPVDPVDPVTPVKPTKPTTPTDPTEPTEPAGTTTPATPTDPTDTDVPKTSDSNNIMAYILLMAISMAGIWAAAGAASKKKAKK